MTYRVIIEPTAQEGIRQCVRWITQNQTPSAAAKWFTGLHQKIQSLKNFPRRCPVARESDQFPEDIRELLHGRRHLKWHILFTIREDTAPIIYVRPALSTG